MGDRQDIDALLIGALYGELEAADKDRLDAHLSSHPGDRAAMDALAETRTRVRDSLARMPELDPAPAISTLILQEAARRAPRKAAERGGVLAWLSGLFQPIVRHPALAGAMALLLAGGAAGMLYKSGKVDSTEQAEATAPGPVTGAAAPGGAKPDDGEQRDRTDSYQVRLADQEKEKAPPSPPPDDGVLAFDGKSKGKDEGAATTTSHAGNGTPPATKALAKNAPKATAPGYMEVAPQDRQLKTLDDHDALAQNQAGNTYHGAGGTGGASAGAGSGSAGPSGNVGGDASAITATDAPAQAPSPHAAPPPAAYDKAKDAKLDEWAHVQHTHLVQLVKAGNCPDAGKVASEIAARAPEYYAANVENDRQVRGCKQYIDQEKRKKANEQYKSRARNSFEPDMEQPAAN